MSTTATPPGRRFWQRSVDGVPLWQFTLRVLWIAIRLMLVAWLGERGTLFFYQGF